MSAFSDDILVCSFRFLDLNPQLRLRVVCARFRALVDEFLTPGWKVVLRLPMTFKDPLEVHDGLVSVWLSCSAGEISFRSKKLFELLLRFPAAERPRETPSCLFPNLTSLIVGCFGIGAEAMVAFAASDFPKLKSLDVRFNLIGDVGMQALAASSNFPNLTFLDAASNVIGPAGMQAFAASTLFPKLLSLNIMHNRIGSAGVLALAASSFLR
eukprot:RCo027503